MISDERISLAQAQDIYGDRKIPAFPRKKDNTYSRKHIELLRKHKNDKPNDIKNINNKDIVVEDLDYKTKLEKYHIKQQKKKDFENDNKDWFNSVYKSFLNDAQIPEDSSRNLICKRWKKWPNKTELDCIIFIKYKKFLSDRPKKDRVKRYKYSLKNYKQNQYPFNIKQENIATDDDLKKILLEICYCDCILKDKIVQNHDGYIEEKEKLPITTLIKDVESKLQHEELSTKEKKKLEREKIVLIKKRKEQLEPFVKSQNEEFEKYKKQLTQELYKSGYQTVDTNNKPCSGKIIKNSHRLPVDWRQITGHIVSQTDQHLDGLSKTHNKSHIDILLSGKYDCIKISCPDYHLLGISKKKVYGILLIKISDKPKLYICLKICFHRKLPEDAKILSYDFQRKKEGNVFKDEIQFLIRSNTFTKLNCNNKECGIDDGFRIASDSTESSLKNTLKVIHIADDCGDRYIKLDSRIIKDFNYIDDLSSRIDNNFNQIKKFISNFIKNENIIEEWFINETKTIKLWLNKKKLVSLYNIWCKNRFNGDYIGFRALEDWVRKYKIEYQHLSRKRRRVINSRNQFFREEIKKLQTEYSTIYTEKKKQKALQENKDGELNKTASRNRTRASLSTFFKYLKESSMDIVEIEDNYYCSCICPECGHLNERSSEENLTCEKCLHTSNRDRWGALEILRRGRRARTDLTQKT